MYYVLSGRVEVTMDEETREIGHAGVAYMPPNATYSTRFVGDEPTTFLMPNGYSEEPD